MAIVNPKTEEKIETAIRILESPKPEGSRIRTTGFSPGYVDAVFTIWYSKGRPAPGRLRNMLPNPVDYGDVFGYPSENILRDWVHNKFRERALALDNEVSKQLSDHLVFEKVAMLKRHAAVASEMQEIAVEYLRNNAEKLSPHSAIRLWVEGVNIERGSAGIPKMLEKLLSTSDEELQNSIEDMLSRSEVELESIDVEDID